MGNNNSSRYGVVTQLQFDNGDIPKLVGSLNRTYLLEKSRVVSRSPRERNFHVFYQMVGSDDEEFKKSLQLAGESCKGIGGVLIRSRRFISLAFRSPPPPKRR